MIRAATLLAGFTTPSTPTASASSCCSRCRTPWLGSARAPACRSTSQVGGRASRFAQCLCLLGWGSLRLSTRGCLQALQGSPADAQCGLWLWLHCACIHRTCAPVQCGGSLSPRFPAGHFPRGALPVIPVHQLTVFSANQLSPACLPTSAPAGHSLGGALAVIAAHELTQMYPQAHVAIYTFGAPRVNGCCCAGYPCCQGAHLGIGVPVLRRLCTHLGGRPRGGWA